MRIKKIEVHGFKSFADRQTVLFDERVTGVIGPNGCGKSNIVDAVRWCLGEQRAKHLRGSGMGDVIFGGTATRGEAGMSEVTITFENEGDVAPPYANHAEIGVTRRLFRDGTSEYLINKVPCRLRDINDMLMGTGIGKSGYSIIEQGRVGQIVTSKPEHRRTLIDEAAGITKFKLQKAAAERKIGQTQQNLLRVTDVISELETRLAVLKRQAQKAERYRNYKDQLTDLELPLSASHKFLELRPWGASSRAAPPTSGNRWTTSRPRWPPRTRAWRPCAWTSRSAIGPCPSARRSLFGLENQISLNEQDRGFQRQEREQLESSIAQSGSEIEVGQRAVANLEEELAHVDERQAGLGDGKGDNGEQAVVARLTSDYDGVRAELMGASEAADQARREARTAESDLARCQTRLAGRRAQLEAAEARLSAASDECDTLRAEHTDASAQLEDARDAAAAQAGAGRGGGPGEAAARAGAGAAQGRGPRRRGRRGDPRQEPVRARSRLTSLEEIQQRYRGCASGVQVVMEHRARARRERAARARRGGRGGVGARRGLRDHGGLRHRTGAPGVRRVRGARGPPAGHRGGRPPRWGRAASTCSSSSRRGAPPSCRGEVRVEDDVSGTSPKTGLAVSGGGARHGGAGGIEVVDLSHVLAWP